MNIIADVGGQFKALKKLLSIMPKGLTVLVGDLNDRGPMSKQVIELAMSSPDIITLQSNHGDMFVDFVLTQTDPDYSPRYIFEAFYKQGGLETLISYGAKPTQHLFE